MTTTYFYPVQGGRWATSKTLAGKRIYLVQNSPQGCAEDIRLIFGALDIPYTSENIRRYFPQRGAEAHCPTLELLELFSTIDRTEERPKFEVGV